MRVERPDISDVDLVEGVFGFQDKRKIIGVVSVLASQVQGPAPSKKQLCQETVTMKRRLDDMEETIKA